MLFAAVQGSCGKQGPNIPVCISKPSSGVFICVGTDDSVYRVPYKDTDKWIGFDDKSAKILIESCGIGSAEKAFVTEYVKRAIELAQHTR
jgi:hypothetical protein